MRAFIFITLLCSIVFFTGCSDARAPGKQAKIAGVRAEGTKIVRAPAEETKTVETRTEEAKTVEALAEETKTLEEILQSGYYDEPRDLLSSFRFVSLPFYVRPKSEKYFYLASRRLYDAFFTSLSWCSECGPEENIPENLNEYDYILRVDNSSEIYINSKANTLRFGKSKSLYRLWGDCSDLWGKLALDRQKAVADFPEDQFTIDSAPITEDMDGDGIAENIRLRMVTDLPQKRNPSLYLVIDGNMAPVFDEAFPLICSSPQIHLLDSAADGIKAVIVDSEFNTPFDGSLIEKYRAFKYRNNRIDTVAADKPQIKTAVQGRKVFVKYPRFGLSFSFTVDDTTVENYDPPVIFDADNPDFPMVLKSVALEKNSGGRGSLVTCETSELPKGGRYFSVETRYSFKEGRLVPDSVFKLAVP